MSSSPDFVADEPVTAWRNSGRNASDEYSADPTQNSSTMATAKIGLRNSRIGRMGSLALVSHQQKAAGHDEGDERRGRGRGTMPTRTACRPTW